tara:strand:- start:407 stop:1477 length:1071 start_codon:yes stop_codon:yes gene_type:complete
MLRNIIEMSTTITVKVIQDGGNNKYVLNDDTGTAPLLYAYTIYTFDVSDSSNTGHPLQIHSDQNGTIFNSNTSSGTPGQSGATVTFTPTLTGNAYLYCTVHGYGMGSYYTPLIVTATRIIYVTAPTFTSNAVTTAIQDIEYSYTVTTTDADGDNVIVTAAIPASSQSWLSFTNNVLSGTPTNSDVGNHSIILTANDGTFSIHQAFTIVVAANNNPPSFTSNVVTTAIQDVEYSYTVTTNDADGDNVTVTETIPTASQNWLSFTNNVLSGTPTNSDVGNHNIVLTANDGTISTTQTFTIVVVANNNAPIVTSTPVVTVPSVYMGGMFSDNSLVYYKPKSLSSGTGSVRNCRVKGRRT